MTKIDVFALPVFAPADVFPMMGADDLQELADDIKENGLREPLVIADVEAVNGDGEVMLQTMLVDGRNRRAACKIAEVAPAVRLLNGEDPTAYVISANLHRRHMTNGQRAMAVALIRPEPEQGKGGGRGKKNFAGSGEVSGVAHQRISQARMVLKEAPGLVDQVLGGSVTLDAAYRTAVDRQKADEWQRLDMDKLRRRAPDLAQRVGDDELSVAEAKTLLHHREEEQRNVRRTVFIDLAEIRRVASFARRDAHRELPAWLEDEDCAAEFRAHVPGGVEELHEAIVDLGAATKELEALAARLPRKRTRR
jgi:ParB-like nuclease domain